VRDSAAVQGYVSKYVLKGGEIDIGGVYVDPPEVLSLPFATAGKGRVFGPGLDNDT